MSALGGDPRSDVVAHQYQKWVYPTPIEDLPSWLGSNWQWFDPSHAYRSFWPDRGYRPEMRILVAGCGTNQAATIAYTNPSSVVVGIDVSSTSLEHQLHLKDKYGLGNLEVRLLPIEEAGEIEGDFDLVMSTGVLHHLADPRLGMQVLGDLLAPDGVLAVMLYATFGRSGVEMMQAVFRDLALTQDESSLAIVKQALAAVPSDHPVRRYIAAAPDLNSDAGLVDTFLHGRDRSYTVQDCLSLVSEAGLEFQDWFFKAPYELAEGDSFVAAVSTLSAAQRWAIAERLNGRLSLHYFMACRPERQSDSFRIDFSSEQRGRFIPEFRYRCRLDGDFVVGPRGSERLDELARGVLSVVDGMRSLDEIAEHVHALTQFDDLMPAEVTEMVSAVLHKLWRRDFLAIGWA